jgi:hypothetical protein
MLPPMTNSFFSASAWANVAVYCPVCAAAMLLAKAIIPTIERKFLTYSLPLSHTVRFNESILL